MNEKVWCVVLRNTAGLDSLACFKDGAAAVFFNRKDALTFRRDLREYRLAARVVPGRVVLEKKAGKR